MIQFRKNCHPLQTKILVLLILCVCGLEQLSAQHLYPFRNRVEDAYNFWLYTPPSYSDSSAKPLVVFLHGSSLCGKNLDRVRRYGPLNAIEMGLDINALVLAPQNSGGAWKPSKVWRIVDWLTDRYPIDTNRIYVLGMSLGGYGTIDLTAAYPQKIAAAMALCGGGNTKDFCPLNKVPLWILQGTADRAVGISQSQRVVDAINRCNSGNDTSRLIWTRLQGLNHGQLVYAFYLDETYQWLFSHSLSDKGRHVNRNVSLSTENINRNVYRYLRRDKSNLIVHSSAPRTYNHRTHTTDEEITVDTTYTKETVAEKAPSKGKSKYHTIKKGDTLGAIARKHHTTVKKLCQLNGLKENSTLKVGRKIRVR